MTSGWKWTSSSGVKRGLKDVAYAATGTWWKMRTALHNMHENVHAVVLPGDKSHC